MRSRDFRLSLLDTQNYSRERNWVQLKERKNLRAFFSRGEREEKRDDDGLLRVWKTDDTTNAPKAFRAVVVRAAAAAFFFFFFFFCPREDVSASRNG